MAVNQDGAWFDPRVVSHSIEVTQPMNLQKLLDYFSQQDNVAVICSAEGSWYFQLGGDEWVFDTLKHLAAFLRDRYDDEQN